MRRRTGALQDFSVIPFHSKSKAGLVNAAGDQP